MLPKTTAEQRSQFYGDVETLLSPGFLTHPVRVAGVRFQLRSLAPGDLFMLRARAEGATHTEWRIWMLASSIWLVDGISVLGQDSAVPVFARYLRHLPEKAISTMFSVLLGLFSRSQRSVQAALAYCYETESRYKWATYGKERTGNTSGVTGAEKLGLNSVQQIWLAFNQYEDARLLGDQQWEGFKLVASSNSPKALKKLDDRDRQRHQEEQDRRERVLDTFFYEKIGVLKPAVRGAAGLGSSHRLASKSVEDLEDEMRRWVTGDADVHDQTVMAYKSHIRDQREKERAEMASRRQALAVERARLEAEAAEEGYRPQPLMALTGEQLHRMLQDKGPLSRPGMTFIPTAPSAERLYDKYVAEGAETSGNLQVAGTKVFDPQADPETDARTLNQLIRERNPSFGSGD